MKLKKSVLFAKKRGATMDDLMDMANDDQDPKDIAGDEMNHQYDEEESDEGPRTLNEESDLFNKNEDQHALPRSEEMTPEEDKKPKLFGGNGLHIIIQMAKHGGRR